MIILNEAELFKNKPDLTTLKPKEQINAVQNLLRKRYSDSSYRKYIQDSGLEDIIIQSILMRGSDLEENNTLYLTHNMISSRRNPLNKDNFLLANRFLDQERIDLRDNQWILDNDSYNPVFKAKALALLSTSKARRYGDNPEAAKKQILRLNKEDKIKQILSDFQTKNNLNASNIFENILKKESGIKDLKNSGLNILTELKKYIKNTDYYKSLTNNQKAIINNKIDPSGSDKATDETLRKFLNVEVDDVEDFNIKLNKIIKYLAE